MAKIKLSPPVAVIRLKFFVRLVSSGLKSATAARHRVRLPAKKPVRNRLKKSPVRDSALRLRAVKVYPMAVPRIEMKNAFFLPNLSENCPMREAPKNCARGKAAIKRPRRMVRS